MPDMDDLNIGRSSGRMSSTGRKLETQISREVYQEKKISDSRLKTIRIAAYKLIYNLSPDEKISLIRSYGDISLLPNNATIEQINEQLVESMIINLSSSELNALVSKQRKKEHEFSNIIDTSIKNTTAAIANTMSSISSSGRANIASTGGAIPTGNMARSGNSGSNKINIHNMETADFFVTKQASTLSGVARKEIREVLDGMGNIQIGITAQKLGISYAGLAPKEVKEKIMNFVSMYVAAITGKSKVIPPVDTVGMAAINDILRYTSLAYIAGLKGKISPKEIAQMKKDARKNKALINERSTIANMESTSTNSKYFKEIAGRTGKGKALENALEFNDSGVLQNKTLDELVAMAISLGIEVDEDKMSIGVIKKLIYQKLASNIRRQKNIENELVKARAQAAKGKKGAAGVVKELEAQLDANKQLTTSKDKDTNQITLGSGIKGSTKLSDSIGSGVGGAVPLIKFDKDKNSLVDEIDVAVPVWIVGQGAITKASAAVGNNSGNTALQDASLKDLIDTASEYSINPSGMTRAKLIKAIEKAVKKNTKTLNKDKLTHSDKKLQSQKDSAAKRIEKEFKEQEKALSKKKIGDSEDLAREFDLLNMRYKLALNRISSVEGENAKEILRGITLQNNAFASGAAKELDKDKETKEEQEKLAQAKSSVVIRPGEPITDDLYNAMPVVIVGGIDKFQPAKPGIDKLKLKSGSNKISTVDYSSGLSRDLALLDDKDKGNKLSTYFNSAAKKLLPGSELASKKVTPVWITNGFTEYLTTITENGLQNIQNSTSSIYSYLSTSMPVLFAGLQEAGTAFNLAAASSGAVTALEAVTNAANAIFANLGKVNTVDVPRFATGGTATAMNSNISQLIAGDSLNGKPNEELVSIDWNKKKVTTTPTNANDTSSSGNLTNISRMTSFERNIPMSVSMATAVTKYKSSYLGDSETSDNYALKVYPITPSIVDKININGTEISLMDTLVGMYGTLSSIEGLVQTVAQTSAANLVKPTSGGNSASPTAATMDQIDASTSSLGPILRGD